MIRVFEEIFDAVFVYEKVGAGVAGEPDDVPIVIFDPSPQFLVVEEFDDHGYLVSREPLDVFGFLVGGFRGVGPALSVNPSANPSVDAAGREVVVHETSIPAAGDAARLAATVMTPRAILFDMGRVLVDFDMSGCEATLQSRSQVDMDQLMRIVWDSGVARAYERGETTAAEFYGHVKTHASLDMTFAQFMKCWTEVFDPVPILPPHFLPAIAGRFPLTLVSNTNEAHAAFVRDNYDVFGHFTNLVLSYEVGSLKPDPVIYHRAIEVSGFSAPDLLFIDDREENIGAASELGIRAYRFEGVDWLIALFASMGVDLE